MDPRRLETVCRNVGAWGRALGVDGDALAAELRPALGAEAWAVAEGVELPRLGAAFVAVVAGLDDGSVRAKGAFRAAFGRWRKGRPRAEGAAAAPRRPPVVAFVDAVYFAQKQVNLETAVRKALLGAAGGGPAGGSDARGDLSRELVLRVYSLEGAFLRDLSASPLVPEHRVLDSDEAAERLAELRATAQNIMPVSYRDPALCWIFAQPGDLVAISNGTATNYRRVTR